MISATSAKPEPKGNNDKQGFSTGGNPEGFLLAPDRWLQAFMKVPKSIGVEVDSLNRSIYIVDGSINLNSEFSVLQVQERQLRRNKGPEHTHTQHLPTDSLKVLIKGIFAVPMLFEDSLGGGLAIVEGYFQHNYTKQSFHHHQQTNQLPQRMLLTGDPNVKQIHSDIISDCHEGDESNDDGEGGVQVKRKQGGSEVSQGDLRHRCYPILLFSGAADNHL